MNEFPGLFLVFDGIDGAGKTTQVGFLRAALEAAGLDVLVSKEPTSGPWGQRIRASASTGRLPLEEELEAFIRDREAHLEELILPALRLGKIVILDRYFFSTIAYQGARGGNVAELNAQVRELALEPDLSFIIDIDETLATMRILKRDGAVNEFEKAESLKAIRPIYREVADYNASTVLVDGSASRLVVFNKIKDILTSEKGVMRAKFCSYEGGCSDPLYCSFRMTDNCEWWTLRNTLERYSRSLET